MSENVTSFLAMIRDAEGTSDEPDPYRVVYSYNHVIEDMSDHPVITGEWLGAPFGRGISTAAGAYQFIIKTWRALKKKGVLDGYEQFFSAAAQDAAAIELIRGRRALEAIEEGDLRKALNRTSWEWASLPPSRYGQPQRTYSWCEVRFVHHGGTLIG